MKILLSHNYYRSSAPSGEDAVFRNERDLLVSKNVDVTLFERFNDEIDESSLVKKVNLALSGAWSKKTYQDISALIKQVRPDVAHFHNTFPLISPGAWAACQDNGVPVVQTLHNYRFVCPGALLLRNGEPCEDCLGTNLIPAILLRCYRHSLLATSAQAWMIQSNRWRGSFKKLVNRYIALTEFAASRMITGGIPKERISVKPNFLPNPPAMGYGGGRYAVYVGRLSDEKGVRTLVEAWSRVSSFPLKILGSGPLQEELQNKVLSENLNIDFLGFLPLAEVLEKVKGADFQIVPSECYEGFPLTVVEAYACGTPLIASRIGSLDEVVVEGETGLKFEPGNPYDLADKVNTFIKEPEQLTVFRHKARTLFEKKYTADHNYEILMNIYQHAIEDFKMNKSEK